MAFGAYSKLVADFPIFSNSTLDRIVLINQLETQAALIKMRLRKSFSSFPVQATGALTCSGNFSEDEEVVMDDRTFRFKTTPAAIDDIDIGTTLAESLTNLHSAIQGIDNGGWHTGTKAHGSIGSTYSATGLALTARKAGAEGNELTLSTTGANATVTAFTGGEHEVIVLGDLNIWMTVLSLLAGKAISSESGGTNAPLMSRLEFQIREAWKLLDEALYLDTVEGDVLEADSMCPEGTVIDYE